MNTVDRNTIRTMKRVALQRLAKEKGVKAVGPNEQIRAALLELFTDGASTSKQSTVGAGDMEGILQDVKNRITDESQVQRTGTARRSARLTVTKETSVVALRVDVEKGAPETQRDEGHKTPKKMVGLAQAQRSELDGFQFAVKFEHAVRLVEFGTGTNLWDVRPSATDLSLKRKHLKVPVIDDRASLGLREGPPPQKRRRIQRD